MQGALLNILIFMMAVFCGCNLAFAQTGETQAAPQVSQQETSQQAAPQQQIPAAFKTQARAADAVSLVSSGGTQIKLWGVEAISGMDPAFYLRARIELDDSVAAQAIECETRTSQNIFVVAQCENGEGLDLGLHMIQAGYAIGDRTLIYGSAFERTYLQAEEVARGREVGVWAPAETGKSVLSIMGLSIMGMFLLIFSVVCFFIMQGFKKVSEAQTANTDMLARERALRDKERDIFLTMLDSEIKNNKSKIEAYIVVYDEMLRTLQDPDKPPLYKKAGDLIQAQPALDRGIFDRNTDKLDILGEELSSQVIHFYARIKSKPNYINLEPEMQVDEVVDIVDKAVKKAQRLSQTADRLIDLFGQNVKDVPELGDSAD